MPITPDKDTEDERPRPNAGARHQEEPSMATHAVPTDMPFVRWADDDDIPPNPPPEVLDAIAAAAESCRALLARGHELVFTSTPGQRVSIELRGRDDQILNILTPSDVLDVATRGSPR